MINMLNNETTNSESRASFLRTMHNRKSKVQQNKNIWVCKDMRFVYQSLSCWQRLYVLVGEAEHTTLKARKSSRCSPWTKFIGTLPTLGVDLAVIFESDRYKLVLSWIHTHDAHGMTPNHLDDAKSPRITSQRSRHYCVFGDAQSQLVLGWGGFPDLGFFSKSEEGEARCD